MFAKFIYERHDDLFRYALYDLPVIYKNVKLKKVY